jgi:ammonia channel protein AmtB
VVPEPDRFRGPFDMADLPQHADSDSKKTQKLPHLFWRIAQVVFGFFFAFATVPALVVPIFAVTLFDDPALHKNPLNNFLYWGLAVSPLMFCTSAIVLLSGAFRRRYKGSIYLLVLLGAWIAYLVVVSHLWEINCHNRGRPACVP